MKKTILTVLLVLMLLFIWGHSMVPAEASAAESGRVGALLTPFLELFVGKGNVTDHLVRKLAHFSEYAALGVLLGAQLLVHGRTSLFRWSYVLLCALAAEPSSCLWKAAAHRYRTCCWIWAEAPQACSFSGC